MEIELRKKLGKLADEMAGIVDAGFTSASRKRFDALEAEARDLKRDIERKESSSGLNHELDQPTSKPAPPQLGGPMYNDPPPANRAKLGEAREYRAMFPELANGNGERETRPGLGDPGSNEVPMPERRGPGTRGDDRISPAQQKFVTDLCRSLDPPIAIAELNARIRELYPPAESIYDIRRREASQLIDSLKEQKKRAA